MLKNFLTRMYGAASDLNRANLVALLQEGARGPVECLLDIGCDDGDWTSELAKATGAGEAHGVEIVPEAAARAAARGIQVWGLNANEGLRGVPSDYFDAVHSNQVIEHVTNVDTFVSEIYRVLRPGGYAVVSTENGSSWHNVGAAAIGWQIFSLTNVSERVAGLGNPWALQRGKEAFASSWTHKTIFNYRGLLELFEVHGFRELTMRGAGYFPLPARLGRVDVRHSAFITIGARK
ncbi:MAG TPA: methyltransferase domain-containing protein [Thermoanaerobaculia bacterium]